MDRRIDRSLNDTSLNIFNNDPLLKRNNLDRANELLVEKKDPSLLIDFLIKNASAKGCDARGGNSECFIFGDHALIKGKFNSDKLDELMKRVSEAKKEGINAVSVLGYKLDESGEKNYNPGWVLQERAKGQVLHERVDTRFLNNATPEEKAEYLNIFADNYKKRIEELTSVPKEHIDKFLTDWMKLLDLGIRMDPSKVDNFFYDKENGFSFIDLAAVDAKIVEEARNYFAREVLVVFLNVTVIYGGKVPEDKKEMIFIKLDDLVKKITESMISLGLDKEKIEQEVSRFEFLPQNKK